MLDADVLPETRIGSARDVAGRVDAGRARFQKLVDEYAAVDLSPAFSASSRRGFTPTPKIDEIGLQCVTTPERGFLLADRRDRVLEMEDDAVFFMQRTDEIAHLSTENALHRTRFRRDDMNLDPAGPQRGRDLRTDETRPYDNYPARRFRRIDDGTAIFERPQRVDVRQLHPQSVA